MIYIEDEIHAEQDGPFDTFEDAVAELRRRAVIAWDMFPNQAPCTAWRTCGRDYHLLEFDDSEAPWKLLRSVPVLSVSAKGVEWKEGFDQAWAAFEVDV
ncbi:MAG TPA: hypothetical protein VGS41_14540 [Chthonomonadales bacterium]|nr:hypothetical protein [Chthonomonadales bacterium]